MRRFQFILSPTICVLISILLASAVPSDVQVGVREHDPGAAAAAAVGRRRSIEATPEPGWIQERSDLEKRTAQRWIRANQKTFGPAGIGRRTVKASEKLGKS